MERPSRKRVKATIPFKWTLPSSEPPPELDAVLHAAFATTAEVGRPDCIFVRVSTREQRGKGNLWEQAAGLAAHLRPCAAVWREVGSGAEPLLERRLAYAVRACAGGTLWAETLDRFLRSYWWETKYQNEWPSIAQVEELVALAREHDVRLATVVPAWASMATARGRHRERGWWAANKKGKELWGPLAKALAGSGWSQNDIAKALGVNQSTVSRWLG